MPDATSSARSAGKAPKPRAPRRAPAKPASASASASASAPSPSPWPAEDRQAQRALKREAVLRTAAQLFNEKGYAASTLEEVAERLGVSKPTVYYYVDGKDTILYECVKTGLDMMLAAIEQVESAGGTAREKLLAAMRAYAGIVTQDFGRCIIRIGEDPLPPAEQRKLRAMKAEIDGVFRQLIAQGIAEGAIAAHDPKLAAFTLAGALSWIGRWYDPEGELGADQVAEACINVLIAGLGAPAFPPLPHAGEGRGEGARSA